MHPPVTGRTEPKNTTNYRALKVKSNLGPDPIVGNLMAAINVGNSGGHTMCLQVVPARTDMLPEGDVMSGRHVTLHNHNIYVCAASLVAYSFAVYGFNSGHFVGTSTALPIQVAVSADTHHCGRAMFKKYTSCPKVCDSASILLQNIVRSKAKTTIHCYCIHTHRFLKQETEKTFWPTQIAIIN